MFGFSAEGPHGNSLAIIDRAIDRREFCQIVRKIA